MRDGRTGQWPGFGLDSCWGTGVLVTSLEKTEGVSVCSCAGGVLGPLASRLCPGSCPNFYHVSQVLSTRSPKVGSDRAGKAWLACGQEGISGCGRGLVPAWSGTA